MIQVHDNTDVLTHLIPSRHMLRVVYLIVEITVIDYFMCIVPSSNYCR